MKHAMGAGALCKFIVEAEEHLHLLWPPEKPTTSSTRAKGWSIPQ